MTHKHRIEHRIGRAALALVAVLAVASPALAEKPDWAGGGHGNGGGHGKGHGQGPAWTDDADPGAGHGKGQGPGKSGQHGGQQGGGPGGAVVVSRTDVTVIRDYFASNPVGASALPPGVAKNLARGKPLPPGIAKKMAPIELRQRVPVCMNGWECILAGVDMLILDAVHGTIADIVRNVVR
ncbi:anti-virulence regulator CigR family protein [Azospirillum sp. sgz302134]